MSETALLRAVMLAAPRVRAWLFRNNVGLFYTRDGRPVRTGLAVGSSDTIGWTEHVIRPEDVGRTVAVFTAYETKTTRGRLTAEQQKFIDAVRRSGGIAGVIRNDAAPEDSIRAAVTEWRDG